MTKQSPKSWLESSTIRAGLLAFSITVATVAYRAYKEKEFQESDLIAVGTAALAFNKVIEGRAKATDPIYTPNGLPGPNKPDPTDAMEEMVTAALSHQTREVKAKVNDAEKNIISEIDEETTSLSNPSFSQTPTKEKYLSLAAQQSRSNGEVQPLGLLNRVEKSIYTVKVTHDTLVKTTVADSSLLDASETKHYASGTEFKVGTWSKDVKDHILVTRPNSDTPLYVYIPHIQLFDMEGKLIGLADNVVEDVVGKIDQTNKTLIHLPNIGDKYLEDAIYPGSHFTIAEFTRNGERLPTTLEEFNLAVKTAKVLDKIRKHFGNKPVVITSWLRPYAVNRAVNGSSNSRHLYGDGVDFYIPGVAEELVWEYIKTFHIGGAAIKPKAFTHLDCRPLKPGDPGYPLITWFY